MIFSALPVVPVSGVGAATVLFRPVHNGKEQGQIQVRA